MIQIEHSFPRKEPETGGTIRKAARVLERLIYPLARWVSYIAMAATVAMMFLVTIDVFMRRALNNPILGSYEVGKILLVIVVFFSVAWVMAVRGHVFVDSLTRLYPPKLKKISAVLANFLSLLIVALICWQSFVYGVDMVRVGETSVLLRILVGPFILIVAFGSALFFLVILVQFVYTLAGVELDEDQTTFCY